MNSLKIIASLTLVLLMGCVSKPSHAPAKPVVTKIAIFRVKELTEATLQNKNGVQILAPIAAAGFAIDSHSKQHVFSERVIAQNMSMGKDLTDYLLQALEKAGYQVVLIDGERKTADGPEDIDADEADTDADAVLQVSFDEVGLLSDSFSSSYLPRVNIKARLYSKGLKTDLYDETLCYGVDARADKSWAIVADPKFAYPSFDNVMARIPEISAVFASGTQAIGERLVGELKAVLK